ncbi:apolipoprotein F [Passer montanus]|uniref:apolipoprotein F n=1 Tax=Passer montanus TaxID=9160 RepID=UPI001960914B|nr:apolipoprotein F [Passer montanus]
MMWILLFLPLLILGGAASVVTPGLAAGDRALLAELAGLAEPVPRRAPGIPCRALGPDALPGFSRLPPLPRAALLRGLARLPGAPAPRPLALLLLSLARPGGSACVDPTRLRTPTEPTAPSGWQFPVVRPCRGAVRRRREDEDACSPAGEREAHRVLDWVPGVSVFYNLGTSVYFAFQGCQATASTRALEAAEDLGYAGLAALTGGLGGPVALGVQLGLQPGLKAGVRALVGYFTSAGEPSPVPTAHSGAVVIV